MPDRGLEVAEERARNVGQEFCADVLFCGALLVLVVLVPLTDEVFVEFPRESARSVRQEGASDVVGRLLRALDHLEVTVIVVSALVDLLPGVLGPALDAAPSR